MARVEITSTLLDPETAACPFAHYDELREKAPVYRMPETGFYLITRYEDLREIVADPETYSNSIAMEAQSGERTSDGTNLGEVFAERLAELGWGRVRTLHRTDAPEHTRYRRLMNRALAPGMVRRMMPDVERIADDLIDAFIDRDSCEFIRDFAFPLPGTVIAHLIGMDDADMARFKTWADAMLAPAQGLLVDEESARHYAAIEAEAQHHMAEVFEERRRNPADDLMSAMIAPPDDGDEPFTMHELMDLMNQLITGGYTTTADAIGNGMLLLLENPDQMALLRREPALVQNFVHEVMRHSTSVQGLFRRTTRDVTLNGVDIPRDSILHIRYGAANRDPETFPQPEAFDITRENASKNLAFSRGPHFCVGQPLAIQEMVVGFQKVLERMDDIALVPGFVPQRAPGFFLYSLTSLPLTFTRA
jgi:cytochrome P450